RQDVGAARQALDAARDLLGGGPAIESVERDLKQIEARDTRTQAILDQADTALATGHILGPDGAAALYQHLLEADKGSALAKAGLGKCADALAEQARTALAAGDLAGATARADDIGRILPTYPGLPDVLGQITKAREAQSAHVSALVERAEQQLHAGNLVGGAGSARALFESAQQTDPGNRHAAAGLRDVARALVRQSVSAIDDDHVDRAKILLDQATALAPDLPALREAKSNLRELRERLALAAAPAPVSAADAQRVAALVAQAGAAAAAGKLIVPPGDSAYDKYRAALAIDRDNASALDGLARLAARARELFDQALKQNMPFRARGLLDAERQLAPTEPAIADMSARLTTALLDQAEARLIEGRTEEAGRALDAARKLSPNNPRLATLDAKLRSLSQSHG
ncbi:MAG: hypothetical protein WCE70_08750, partial [Rhodanobacteraceae bacterium]